MAKGAQGPRSSQGPKSSQPSGRQLRPKASQRTQVVVRRSPTPPSAQLPKRASRSHPATKAVTQPPREGAAKKKAMRNREPSAQEEDEEENNEEQEEEEGRREAILIEEEAENTRQTRTRDTNVKLARIQLAMAKLLEAASNLPGGYQAIQQVIEHNAEKVDEEIQVERPENGEGEADEAEEEESENEQEEDVEVVQEGQEGDGDEEIEEPTPEPVRHHPKVPIRRKKRNPWSQDEERFLITAVNKHGARWALIETKYAHGELYGRNQGALRDKARNIMRRIIDCGNEEIWLNKYPKWAEVYVGPARRGVHDYAKYPNGVPPEKDLQRKLRKLEGGIEDDTD